MPRLPRLAFLLPLLLLPTVVHAEREPVLPAAELVEPSLLTGPGYRVQSRVELHGLQARFWIDTRWGGFAVDSVELLAQRIDEMPAVDRLYAQTVTDLLADTGIDALLDPARAVATLAADPVGAASRAPRGLLRWFSDRWRRIGDRAARLGHRIDRAVFHDGSADAGTFADGRADPHEPWWDKPADEAGRLLRSEADHGKARRDLAASLGIDPSTSHPLLRARLDQLAWAVAAGRIGSDRLIALASAGTASAIGEIERIADLTAVAPPDDLRRQAALRLQQWTADGNLIHALAWRGGFPPERLQQLLDRIDRLAPASGVQALLETARLAGTELEARFVLNALDMLLAEPEHPVSGGDLLPAGALVAYRSTDGEFMLPLPVDRLSWTPEVQRWFDDLRIADHPRRTVLVGGGISPRAARALTRRGWSLREFYRWPGAPPYRRPGAAA